MDRIAPTRRPPGQHAGTQRWRELLFVHYEVPADAVLALLPKGLSLDLWEGRAFVGIVPFHMRRIAPPFYPSALGLSFLETNLRTYVHVEGEGPGVYFFSLEASNKLAVRVARTFWGLPYFDATMRAWKEGDVMAYTTSRRGQEASLEARFRLGAPASPAAPDTLEFYLLERYLLYVERRSVLHVGQVHHTPYPTQQVELLEFRETLRAAAGLPGTSGPPAYVHYSPGVDVEVFATHETPFRAR